MLQLVKSIGKSDTEFHQYRKQTVHVQLVAKHRENRMRGIADHRCLSFRFIMSV
jgi:hypothetical protein